MVKLPQGVPVIGFCGYSGSGKTTLIEKLVPRLKQRGLVVGYLKHDAHKLEVDTEGKDTHRVFKAGVDMLAASSPEESFVHSRSILPEIANFSDCDIVLVEGYKDSPWDKLWVNGLDKPDDELPKMDNVVGEIGGEGMPHDDIDDIEWFLVDWLSSEMHSKPLFGGLLIGGKSRRMGEPKTMLEVDGQNLAEKNYRLLSNFCDKTFLLGQAELPESLHYVSRLIDVMDVPGPLGGILAARRYYHRADWLIMAVDMPNVTEGYIADLKELRQPGYRFVGARNPDKDVVESTCGIYSSQLLFRIDRDRKPEETALHRALAMQGVKGNKRLYDKHILSNLNTPEDLDG